MCSFISERKFYIEYTISYENECSNIFIFSTFFLKKLGVSIADIFLKKIFNFSDTFRKAGFFGKQKNSQINNQFYWNEQHMHWQDDRYFTYSYMDCFMGLFLS